MKHIYMAVILAFVCQAAIAQSTLGFTGGVSFASMKAKQDGLSATTDAKPGITAGIVVNHIVSEQLTLQPMVLYTQKGGKRSEDGETFGITFNYLELPVNLLYTHPKFFVGGGPSFGYALSGKMKYSTPYGSFSEDADFAESTNRFELGGNLTGGFNFTPNVFLALNYNFAFTSMSPKNEGTLLNRYFAFKVGVLLPSHRSARERR